MSATNKANKLKIVPPSFIAHYSAATVWLTRSSALWNVFGERRPCVKWWEGGWEGQLCCPVPWSHSGCALQTALKPSARKAETSVWVWGRLRLPFLWPWRCLCLLVPVAASLEGHQQPAPPLPLQLLLLLGYRRGQIIATANKACRPLKSAQCQLSQSERVKYGYWKLHWAAPASFSTSCLPVTWFNIERLFYSNWPRQLFLLAV